MSDQPQNGPGAELKAAREGMDVSTREVADALNLPVNVIESLEADDYERLPPTVFTRGYLRSYARLLELSPDALLARYPEVTEEVDAITGEMATVEPTGLPPTRTLGIAAVVGVILIALLVWLLGAEAPSEPEPDALDPVAESAAVEEVPATTTAARVETESAPLTTEAEVVESVAAEPVVAEQNVAEPAASEQAADQAAGQAESAAEEVAQSTELPEQSAQAEVLAAPETVAEPEPDSPARDDRAPAEVEAQATAIQSPGPAPAPSYRERRITEFGDDEITFVFSEDCWVEVKSVSGDNLYSDLNRTGRTLVLTGRAPFRVLLGYAPGVSLSFNGEPVELARYSRNNVANLVLGE